MGSAQIEWKYNLIGQISRVPIRPTANSERFGKKCLFTKYGVTAVAATTKPYLIKNCAIVFRSHSNHLVGFFGLRERKKNEEKNFEFQRGNAATKFRKKIFYCRKLICIKYNVACPEANFHSHQPLTKHILTLSILVGLCLFVCLCKHKWPFFTVGHFNEIIWWKDEQKKIYENIHTTRLLCDIECQNKRMRCACVITTC